MSGCYELLANCGIEPRELRMQGNEQCKPGIHRRKAYFRFHGEAGKGDFFRAGHVADRRFKAGTVSSGEKLLGIGCAGFAGATQCLGNRKIYFEISVVGFGVAIPAASGFGFCGIKYFHLSLGRFKRQAEIIGNLLIGHFAVNHVHALEESFVHADGFLEAVIGKKLGVFQGAIG